METQFILRWWWKMYYQVNFTFYFLLPFTTARTPWDKFTRHKTKKNASYNSLKQREKLKKHDITPLTINLIVTSQVGVSLRCMLGRIWPVVDWLDRVGPVHWVGCEHQPSHIPGGTAICDVTTITHQSGRTAESWPWSPAWSVWSSYLLEREERGRETEINRVRERQTIVMRLNPTSLHKHRMI